MCGIFGISLSSNSQFSDKQFRSVVRKLFILSESRGKEASGLAGTVTDKILVHKSPQTASELVKSNSFREVINRISDGSGCRNLIGHSRLVTNGYEHFNKNNQPVVNNDMIVVHNGIIVNYRELWDSLVADPKTDLDSEIIPAILFESLTECGSMSKALKELFAMIYGMTSIAMMTVSMDALFLATNNGSLYYCHDTNNSILIFASERYILEKAMRDEFGEGTGSFNEVAQLQAGGMLMFDPSGNKLVCTALNENVNSMDVKVNEVYREVQLLEVELNENKNYVNTSFESVTGEVPTEFEKVFEERREQINELKRCKKCTLPESFPYIEYDENGVCNYCSNYHPIEYLGADKLRELAEGLKRKDSRPECLVPFSGGRDSSYVLHYLVHELGLKPLAFSYDWGMITDLARRNQSRLCGKLGVEHILVSADIRRKRKYISQNVSAWLKKPELGMVPLFMAGDKQYFYYTQKLLRENNLGISFLGENLLETTNFKSGFAGIKPIHGKDKTYSLSMRNKFAMLLYYAGQYVRNPAYINSSLIDTAGSFKSYYMLEHTSVNLFNFIEWDEKEIINLLRDEYDWETDPGTSTTWRIGDGTAAFYNYIYYMAAGFNENDTFRSNQIREGIINRETAIQVLDAENKPRWDSIKWYCNTIGIDFRDAIKRVNDINPIY